MCRAVKPRLACPPPSHCHWRPAHCSPLASGLLSHAGQHAKSRGECAPAAGVRRRAVEYVCVAMAVLRHSSTIICRRAGNGHAHVSRVARGVCE